ncbi:tail fiber protein [Shigella phage SH6]|uniref:Tail fiber protein n=1 Tax=Shigella phage SH6 TaxID=1913048 RepID=A0A1J0GT37_9CAUD|nr:tail fiber protein [Shigella phage SH6]APC44917.1 tail fiber protein [Shigella phage SH6]
MALYRRGTASMDADGTVHGTDTKWKDQLALIRVGATIVFLEQPIKLAVISDIVSDTEMKAISTDGQTAADGKYVILLSDSLTVNGLAQNVAETLRYYQSKETEIAAAIDLINQLDMNKLEQIVADVNQAKSDSQAAQNQAELARDAANAARDETNSIKNQTQNIVDGAIGGINAAKDQAITDIGSKESSVISHIDTEEASAIQAINDAKGDLSVYVNDAQAAAQTATSAKNDAQLARNDAVSSKDAAAVSAQEAKDAANSINADNLLTKDGNLAGLENKSEARANLDLGSVSTENTVPIEKGGTAATTAAAARANLGVGDDSLVKLGALHLNGGESVVLNALEANSTSLSNALYGIDNWVGMTMHRWYADWTRAGIVRAGDTHLSDYRIHVWKNGMTESLFRFLPDGRLISGNSGNPSVNEFQKAPLSDRDLKKEIQYTDGEESYNRVRQWLPAMFKYKDSDVQRYGLIAQDLAMIDPEYVHLLPGHAIYEDIKGVDEEGNEVVVDRKEIGYTDDVLSLDSNVLLMDLCAAFVYKSNKVSALEKEVEELKTIVSELISK